MFIKRAACLAFTAACLTGIATLPAAHAQTAYGTGTGPGTYGAMPGTYGTAPGSYGTAPGMYGTAPGTYGTTAGTYAPQPFQGYPAAPSAAGAGNTEVVTNGPQGYQPPGWSPERNVRESEHYDRLLGSNRAFREARERRECGPIADPQLHQQCVASFEQFEPNAGPAPSYGSSTATGGYGSTHGQ